MNKFKKIISRALKISPAKITDKTSPLNVASWDSFRGLILVTEIEKAYKTKFSMEEILSIRDIGRIKKILLTHNIDIDE